MIGQIKLKKSHFNLLFFAIFESLWQDVYLQKLNELFKNFLCPQTIMESYAIHKC